MISNRAPAVDITVAITAHREGPIAGPTIRSAIRAIAQAKHSLNLRLELYVILDRADELTTSTFKEALVDGATIFETDFGDPGQARNFAAREANGTIISFLDGDDLWSSNWLEEGWRFCQSESNAIGHCACILTFGEIHGLWWHIDSSGGFFRPNHLIWTNYWDAMTIGRTELYREIPFRANDLKRGFGHEDWHWNCASIARGVAHKPVPNTIHFKRRRSGSQMSLVENSDSTVWPE